MIIDSYIAGYWELGAHQPAARGGAETVDS